jgi:hypothetical protein
MKVMADDRKRCDTAFLEELRFCYCSLIQVFFLQTLEVLRENYLTLKKEHQGSDG